METGSKVSDLVAELRSEETRLKTEIAAARKSVRELQKDIARVRSGIRSLTGASKSGKKKSSGSSSRRKSTTAAVSSASEVINAPREYRYQGSGGEPGGPAASESQQVKESVFEGCL